MFFTAVCNTIEIYSKSLYHWVIKNRYVIPALCGKLNEGTILKMEREMMVLSSIVSIQTSGFSDVHDLTPHVHSFVRSTHAHDGTVTVFVPGSTAGITTIEFEKGAIEDLRKAIERMAPQDTHYEHDARWGDGNGFSHVRAALLGPSVSIPLVQGKLLLGTWQQVVLVDFDNRARKRDVVIQVAGEGI